MKSWKVCGVVAVGMLVFGGVLGAGAQAPARAGCHADSTAPSDAEAALAREEYAAALDLYKKMAATAPDESRAGVIRTLIAQDKVTDADTLGQAWAKEQPENVVAVETLGEVFYREGELKDAFDLAKAAQGLDRCDARIYLLFARIENLTANFKSAKAHIVLAHRLHSQDVEIRKAWIETLAPKERREQWAALLQENKLLKTQDRDDLQKFVAKPIDANPDDCSVATPDVSATLPILNIADGNYLTDRAGLAVKFNGKPRIMQIDSGASGLTLSKYAAMDLGLVREEKTTIAGVGDKGDVATSRARVASLKIGNLEFRNCTVDIVEKFSALSDNGLIGTDVFAKFLVTLDFPHMKLKLDPLPARPDDKPAVHADAPVPSQVPESESEPHDRYIAPEMKDWSSIYREGHQILIPVRIGESKWRLFLMDTGADSMLISPSAARDVTKVKTTYDEHISGLSGDVAKVYETGKFKIEFANYFMNMDSMTSIDTTSLSRNMGVEVSGFLGAPALYKLAVHVDYRDNLIKLEYVDKSH